MADFYADSSVLVKRHVREAGTDWFAAIADPTTGNTILTAQVMLMNQAAPLANGAVALANDVALLMNHVAAHETRVAALMDHVVALMNCVAAQRSHIAGWASRSAA
jgi:hypothetical protein